MHINVSHILASEVGETADFEIKGENPDIPDLQLVKPLTGQVKVTKLDQGVQLQGSAHLAFRLECQRCLDPFDHQADLALAGSFNLHPGEDEWPISARGEINLMPLIREEALVNIPVQQLCDQDCQGLCVDCGQKLADGHKHQLEDVGHKPRIKKGQ